ncbi:E3 SUMO-protein ligase KIAA1586-like isoform X2 [Dreissena polymorpha]|uniref:E3 SUMO-protein ligase KIAA1586-like isoform X2 n=1 Tax=Dreissena polymorpha TaxID=45954 RepID=UPI00226424AE|nr:E3 SUMO-protein ligase KIAA1586-like isoform X2 [Dreissena polymorpha]
MSHNWRNYTKKIKLSDSKNTNTIDTFFKNESPSNAVETHSEVSDIGHESESKKSAGDAPSSNTVADNETEITHLTSSPGPSSEFPIIKFTHAALFSDETQPKRDSRLFNSHVYESRYPWLYHSQTKHGFMCKYCELFGSNSDQNTSYVTTGAVLGDNPSRRLETHNNSDRHLASVEKYSNFQSQRSVVKLLATAAVKQQTDAISRNRSYVKKLFKTVFFMAKKKWAQMNMADLVRFMGDVCDPEIKDIASESVNYLSSTSVTELINTLSEFMERKVLEELRKETFTLLADESTDSCNRTQFSLFVRWVSAKGPVEHYLGLINMDKVTSLALLTANETFFRGKHLQLEKVRFVGLDGCNTMNGENKGLQRRIRHESPLSIYVNCRNHRIALCFVHLLKESDLLKEVDGLLISIWKLFQYSPKKAAVFQHMQEVYGERPIKIVRAATTRWLSHLRACVRFISRYEQLLDTFDALIEDSREPEVQGIRHSATNRGVIAMILVLADVLKPVNYLSLYLQQDCGTFTELPARVKKCTDDLHDIVHNYQNMTLMGLEFGKCEEMFDIITDRTTLARRVRAGVQMEAINPEGFLRLYGVPLVLALVNEVEDAFSNHSAVLSAFSFLDPSHLPEEAKDVHDYGKKERL